MAMTGDEGKFQKTGSIDIVRKQPLGGFLKTKHKAAYDRLDDNETYIEDTTE